MIVGAYAVAALMLVAVGVGIAGGAFLELLEFQASSGCDLYLALGSEGCQPPPGFAGYCILSVDIARWPVALRTEINLRARLNELPSRS